MEHNQTASRSARRFLEDRVRDDWDWPKLPECWSASDEEVRGITSFRERYYGESSPSESDDDAAADPYKFDSPDSIGDAVERKALNRKRKRRAALEEEMKENEGLRMWVERRDAWTGAAAVIKYGTKRPGNSSSTVEGGLRQTATSTEDHASSSSEPSTPMDVDSDAPSRDGARPTTIEPLIPVAHSLLPDNPIRRSITPKAYSDIFNKIVMSSRTPSVPINLADMTRALVQGWQENGEWPPKAAPLDPLAGKKRAAIANVKMEHENMQFLAHHPHIQKGMESVKKILHLNGHHHEHSSHHEGGHGNGDNG
ncbi:hypothetical protein BU26DRAFT_513706 [Trematosphaeria pertusa]|uniref:Gag1-like clamp domain-containing protein n=1 Tax=Trematosphaeria pertusa TaxID=390896 RepID=A0A6A6J2W7_9PLEO|nr:uncharacterized protein BU26DRAFT_513706 [Trematosphaeria pertusa]KAF2256976.1 hypothetical protein BU26DRAFT_513706 [Trematosphaeria pertusa]